MISVGLSKRLFSGGNLVRVICKQRAQFDLRQFSTSDASTVSDASTKEVLLYTGLFAGKMKWLRRISLGSTCLSVAFVPAAMTIQSGILPMAAQIALAGTVFFTSFSSTLLLQVVAHPYVCTLHEIVPATSATSAAQTAASTTVTSTAAAEAVVAANTAATLARRFRATRYNMFGRPVISEFTLGQADRQVPNPFASFQVKGSGFYYIYGGEIADVAVRRALTKEM